MIEEMRIIKTRIGSFLHDYYIKYGASKYDYLVEKMGEKMTILYGENFNSDNLRIMEAEYVINNELYAKTKLKDPNTSSKE